MAISYSDAFVEITIPHTLDLTGEVIEAIFIYKNESFLTPSSSIGGRIYE